MSIPSKSPVPEAPVILAVETSGRCGSVALVTDGRCIAEHSLQSELTHSRRLINGIDLIFRATGISCPDITGIAVSLGPGSFTGLRIGLSTAKGLVLATGKSLLGVITLDGLASQFSHFPHIICPVIDARKNEVYTAFYRYNEENGSLKRISDYLAIPPAKLAAEIIEPTIMIGDGLTVYGEYFRKTLGNLAIFARPEIYFPRAAAIGMLALKHLERGDFLDPATATPFYVRASEAEMNFKRSQDTKSARDQGARHSRL